MIGEDKLHLHIARYSFDADFYRQRNPDLFFLPDDESLYRHFVDHGFSEGRLSSPGHLIAALESRFGRLPSDFNHFEYRSMHPDLHFFKTDWEVKAHYIEHGRAEGRPHQRRGATLERADLAATLGRHIDALILVRTMLDEDPHNVSAHLLGAKMTMRLGDHAAAKAHLATVRRLEPGQVAADWLSDLNEYLEEYPAAIGTAMAKRIEAQTHHLDIERLARRIKTAVDERAPFSFIRFGDGEGAFVSISPTDEVRFARLYHHNRHNRAAVWFDGEVDLESSGSAALASGVSGLMAGADVVGLPHLPWVKHEYSIVSATGISALVNLLRAFEGSGVNVDQNTAGQYSHVDLHTCGFFQNIIASKSKIGLICCHSAAPSVIKSAFNISDVEYYKIPGEKANRVLLGSEAVEGRHFPERFRAVMSALERPHAGQLFLVAGGILGKFYCDMIKRNGGVALDVGSLIDGWVGINTRPGFHGAGLSLRR